MKSSDIQTLYHDTQACAQLVGLTYVSEDAKGVTRQKSGTGFRYIDYQGRPLTDQEAKERIVALAVPPMWEQVWLCPTDNGHIQATGVDEKGRKQYIYHARWRKLRDLLKFYRMMSFGERLPVIRRDIREQLKRRSLDHAQLLALMLWFLDNSYIRIGNEAYYEENETIGLTTLRKENVSISEDIITLDFVGKSAKSHLINLKDAEAASVVRRLMKEKGEKLFTTEKVAVLTPTDCNEYLQELTGEQVSAKDFRTWGGTLAAFSYLKKHRDSEEKPASIAIQAIDLAADALGNTRNVAREHYVHPHILATYTDETFQDYYKQVKPKRVDGLYKDEVELLQFLEILFKKEFDLLPLKKDQPEEAKA